MTRIQSLFGRLRVIDKGGIEKQRVQELLTLCRLLGVRISNLTLLNQALMHRSYVYEMEMGRAQAATYSSRRTSGSLAEPSGPPFSQMRSRRSSRPSTLIQGWTRHGVLWRSTFLRAWTNSLRSMSTATTRA